MNPNQEGGVQKQEDRQRNINTKSSVDIPSLAFARESEAGLQQVNAGSVRLNNSNESQFRKTLLQKVKAARENSQGDETPPHRKQTASSSNHVSEYTRNKTPTRQKPLNSTTGTVRDENSYDRGLKQHVVPGYSDYGNPFTAGLDADFNGILNKMTPKFLKEKSNSFKVKSNYLLFLLPTLVIT